MKLEEQIAFIALGAAIGLPGIGALWKSATLRGDTYDKLSGRVDIARSGLSEFALERLREVQEKTDQHLGDVDASFNPAFAIADPGELVSITRKFEKAVRVRDKLAARFEFLLFICKWVWIPSLVYLVGVVGVTYLYATDNASHLWRAIAFSVGGAGLLVGCVATAMYLWLHNKITSAEILGGSGGTA